ncbi:MAG TPA: alpha/beta hydrolase, partial [Burkholderiaceae bacterium]|nr:alpha/beta hydrolase [Burkholderiaceae bacterium]
GDAILYFGGNAEDVSEVIPAFSKNFSHQSIYLVNYRGYGGSTGEPSETGIFKDALNLYDFVCARQSKDGGRSISVFGRSLGSGVAIYVETNREVKKMVLVTPYDSIENVAKKQFPMFPISLLLKDKFASDSRVAAVSIPTMIILADADEVIPRANSEALIAAFRKSMPTTRIISNSSHNSILTSDVYWQDVSEFLH